MEDQDVKLSIWREASFRAECSISADAGHRAAPVRLSFGAHDIARRPVQTLVVGSIAQTASGLAEGSPLGALAAALGTFSAALPGSPLLVPQTILPSGGRERVPLPCH